MNNLSQLLTREPFGLCLRVFAGKPEAVSVQCDRTLSLAIKASKMELTNGTNVFKNVLIMVASDTRRVDHDCGESFDYLVKILQRDKHKRIRVIEAKHEDLFCGIQNRAAAELLRLGCSYMAMFSNAAHEYLNMEFLEASATAFQAGALVTGLAITELQESISKGLIANTAAIYDIKALMTVGGFDQFAEQPFTTGHSGLFTDERQVDWVQGKRQNGKDALYPRAGVEEIIPLIRLARWCDRACIAPIMPSDGKIWELPVDLDELKRHQHKMATKLTRQAAMSNHINADLSMLEDAVMDGYGWKA